MITHFLKSILCLSVLLVRGVGSFVNSNKGVETREFKKDNRWRFERFEISSLRGAVITIRWLCGISWHYSYKVSVYRCYNYMNVQAAQWYWNWYIIDRKRERVERGTEKRRKRRMKFYGVERAEVDRMKGKSIQDSTRSIMMPVRVGTRVNLNSEDVIHSFSLNKINVHMDCLPRRISSVVIWVWRTGRQLATCQEICGVGHSNISLQVYWRI